MTAIDILYDFLNDKHVEYGELLCDVQCEFDDLQAAYRKVCERIADTTGACPLDECDAWDGCLLDDCDNNTVACYMAYFKGEKRVKETEK